MSDTITTHLTWNGGKNCEVRHETGKAITVTGRANLGENPGSWSPPHLLVSASDACFMLNFLAIAEKARIRIASYESETTATIDMTDGKHKEVTAITIKPSVKLENELDRQRLANIYETAEEYCTVGNSLKPKIKIVY